MFIHRNDIPVLKLKVIENPTGRFYVTPEGNKYPSITTVLGDGDKPWLSAWRESMGQDRAAKETKRAADRGEAVHRMAERYLNNDLNSSINEKLDHKTEFNTIRIFLNKVNNIFVQEAALYSDILKVAGRVDCIGEYGGVLSVIDFKTSTNDKKDSMIQDYYLQTSAYAVMFQERYGVQIDQVVIIMTTERGAVPLVFKRRVEDYLSPLCARINTYHSAKKVK